MSEVPPQMARRDFLRALTGVPIGVLVAGIDYPASEAASNIVENVSGRPTGNASVQELAERDCANADDMKDCIDNWELPEYERVMATTIAPVIEEGMFRTLPSFLMDTYSLVRHNADIDPVINAVAGREHLELNRSEVFATIMSSVIFGVAHNLRSDGFDTKTLPVSQTIGGIVYWLLQRKFGAFSNISGHITHNRITDYIITHKNK